MLVAAAEEVEEPSKNVAGQDQETKWNVIHVVLVQKNVDVVVVVKWKNNQNGLIVVSVIDQSVVVTKISLINQIEKDVDLVQEIRIGQSVRGIVRKGNANVVKEVIVIVLKEIVVNVKSVSLNLEKAKLKSKKNLSMVSCILFYEWSNLSGIE